MIGPSALVLVALVAVTVAVAGRWFLAVGNGRRASRHPIPVAAEPDQWPRVSVIIPAWQEAGTIERCLATVLAVDYPDWELIVVAGGPDGTFEAAQAALAASEETPSARHPTVRSRVVVPQPPGGKPAALNAGLDVARGDVVVFLDADSLVTPHWLRALVAPIRGETRASTGNPRPTLSTPVTRAEQMERIAAYDVHRRFVLQGSGSIAITRATLDVIGGFPERAYADDWDLDARLGLLGYRRAYARSATLLTDRPATMSEFWRNEIRWRRAHLASVQHWPGYFLRDGMTALRTLYPYVLAWLVVALTAATVVVVAVGAPAARTAAVEVWGIVMAGVVLERLALTLEVVACTADRRWVADAWVPPALWLVTLVAAFLATLTTRRATLAFKGPRTLEAHDAALHGPRAR